MCSMAILQRASLVFRACSEVDREVFFGFSSAKLLQLSVCFGGLDSRSPPKSEWQEAGLQFYGFRSRGRGPHKSSIRVKSGHLGR